MILVDSSVWIDYFNGASTAQSEFLDKVLGVRSIAVGDLILAEVLQGFKSDNDFTKAKSLLSEFVQIDLLGNERAISAAKKFRKLRKAGITIRKTNDVIIASYCIDEKLPLLFSDNDFTPFVSKFKMLSTIT